MSYITGYMNGFCQKHGPMIQVGDRNACLKCESITAKANAQPAGIVTEEPPAGWMPTLGEAAPAKKDRVVALPKPVAGLSLEAAVGNAILSLQACPMPKSIKNFKTIQKAIENLQRVIEENTPNAKHEHGPEQQA